MLNRVISVAFIALYALLVHLALIFSHALLTAIAPAVLLTGVLWAGLVNRHFIAWIVYLVGCAVIGVAALTHMSLALILLPPVLIPLALLYVFGRTLLPGKEPLITAIGEASRGPLTDTMRRYTARLTAIWCLIFTLLLVSTLLLTSTQAPATWSWYINVSNNLLVGVFFIGEFYWRKCKFPEHNHPGFFEYLRIIATTKV